MLAPGTALPAPDKLRSYSWEKQKKPNQNKTKAVAHLYSKHSQHMMNCVKSCVKNNPVVLPTAWKEAYSAFWGTKYTQNLSIPCSASPTHLLFQKPSCFILYELSMIKYVQILAQWIHPQQQERRGGTEVFRQGLV